MARKVFFSFHYARDLWRVNVVRNSTIVEGISVVGFQDASLWEEAKKNDAAIKNLINKAVTNSSVTVVLIGAKTANRQYVGYEIRKSIELGHGLLGVRINDIKDQYGNTDSYGLAPADLVNANVPIYTYEYGKLGGWIEAAYKKAYPG